MSSCNRIGIKFGALVLQVLKTALSLKTATEQRHPCFVIYTINYAPASKVSVYINLAFVVNSYSRQSYCGNYHHFSSISQRISKFHCEFYIAFAITNFPDFHIIIVVFVWWYSCNITNTDTSRKAVSKVACNGFQH